MKRASKKKVPPMKRTAMLTVRLSEEELGAFNFKTLMLQSYLGIAFSMSDLVRHYLYLLVETPDEEFLNGMSFLVPSDLEVDN